MTPLPESEPERIGHVLLGWIVSRHTGGHIVAAWCPHCLCMHTHGRPAGSDDLMHRCAHCHIRPGLGDYHVAVLGWWSGKWQRWLRETYAEQLRQRARILAGRGHRRPGRLWWPAPYVPTPWELLERRRG